MNQINGFASNSCLVAGVLQKIFKKCHWTKIPVLEEFHNSKTKLLRFSAIPTKQSCVANLISFNQNKAYMCHDVKLYIRLCFLYIYYTEANQSTYI